MARVTVEDCIEKVENRFELVLLSSQRAREIGTGSPLTVERDNDKNTVVSLREIAEETIDLESLNENMIKSYQKVVEINDDDEDVIDVMDGEMDWNSLSDEDRFDPEALEGAGMRTTDASEDIIATENAENA